MSLESKSKELKKLVSEYNEDWFLGDLWFTIHAGRERSLDQLGKLSSPQRQLNYLAGLTMSTASEKGHEIMFNKEKWDKIVDLLNEIEQEYFKIFMPKDSSEKIDEEWIRKRQVAMPSFLSYFNQGHLNYEEQMINWIRHLYIPLNKTIHTSLGINTEDFIEFYENIDKVIQKNFQAHSTNPELLRSNWQEYTKIEMGVDESVPDFIKELGKEFMPCSYFMADHGIVTRVKPEELISDKLSLDKVNIILKILSCKREEREFLYYTETNPGNPLYDKPIVDIGNNMFQVFDVKQILHAIDNLLENICKGTDKYVEKKGKLLEERIIVLFQKFLKKDYKVYSGYFIDDCEQDILILWKDYAFIIESKAFLLKEPFRDPERAFTRIKRDFNSSIGYAYQQTKRVEDKFINKEILEIKDKNGNIIDKINTDNYQDFSIIVNLNSFGQVQCDLSYLLNIQENDVFPWAVKFDDLEIFLLTLIAQNKKPEIFVDFLLMREELHSKLICDDELEICGGFLIKKITQKTIRAASTIITNPTLGDVFDQQYHKTMGFENEKYLYEKQSGKFMIW